MKVSKRLQKYYDYILSNSVKYFNPNDKYIAICEAIVTSHEPNCPFLGWQIGVYELVDIQKNIASFYLVDTLLNQVDYVQMKTLLRKKIKWENENKAILVSERSFILLKDDNSNK